MMKHTLLALAAAFALGASGTAFAQSSSGSSGGGQSSSQPPSQQSSGGSSGGSSKSSGGEDPSKQAQKQADADYKSAKAQCGTKKGQEKTVCEKEATAKHAQAEVDVEKQKMSMGAGKSQGGSQQSSSK
jgi:hypothetical protein